MSAESIGKLLSEWRKRRRLSQFDLAGAAEISTRHLSFLETGRALPSREMLLHLAGTLDVPLRERNVWLVAAGFAPAFPERSFDDPALQAARTAVELVLQGHEPYPALALDRHWNIIAANRAVTSLLVGVDEALLQSPVNVLRLSLHPSGLAPKIVNLAEWRAHLLERLGRQIDLTADPVLVELLRELDCFPNHGVAQNRDMETTSPEVFVPLKLRTTAGILTFLSTTTVFGTPLDITLSELAVESFFPADEFTAKALQLQA